MHFNIFSEGICGKVGIFYNGKNPIEVIFFKLPLDVGDQPGLVYVSPQSFVKSFISGGKTKQFYTFNSTPSPNIVNIDVKFGEL